MTKVEFRIRLGWKLPNGGFKSVKYRHARGIIFSEDGSSVRITTQEGREDEYSTDFDVFSIRQDYPEKEDK